MTTDNLCLMRMKTSIIHILSYESKNLKDIWKTHFLRADAIFPI